ncbi:MAG: ABC transporter substrate-binding protein [Cyanobacteria bacterium P01_D01_bin.2]
MYNRRQFLQLTTASLGLVASCGRPMANSPASLGVGGSPILLTIPLAYLIERSALRDAIADIEFFPTRNHEQVKALLASGQGQITSNPTLLAAGLYQQGLPIKLLNVMIWGNIYVLSADREIRQWEDLRGKSVLIPFKGGMPEMIFRFLATQSGLQPDQDFTIQSTQDFQSTAQLLLTGAGDVGVFAEPHASNVVTQAQQQDLELFYSLDFKESWSQITGQPARFPQAGISILNSLVDNNPDVVALIQTELRNSLNWIQQNPTDAAELGAQYMDTPAPVIEQSLRTNLFDYVPAMEARPELEVFYQSLMQVNPKLLKGELPNAEFYSQ